MFEAIIGNKFDSDGIYYTAKYSWDILSDDEKKRKGDKYAKQDKISFIKNCHWNVEFDALNDKQKKLLMKAVLINTYDSLDNVVKTRIMKEYGLSKFSSKWFRMPNIDRALLCSSVLKIPSCDQSQLKNINLSLLNRVK